MATAWYVIVEMLSEIHLDNSGFCCSAPGYRLFYRWNEISAIDVLQEPEEDRPATLRVVLPVDWPASALSGVALDELELEDEEEPDDVAAFLSEADLRENRQAPPSQGPGPPRQFAAMRLVVLVPMAGSLIPGCVCFIPRPGGRTVFCFTRRWKTVPP